MAIDEEAAGLLSKPMAEALPLVRAIINGLTFAGQGTSAPHWTYNIDPAVRYLVGLGNKLRTAGTNRPAIAHLVPDEP